MLCIVCIHFMCSSSTSSPLQAYIPLVTVLLSIAEQQFFLNYWGIFLTQIILPNIRVRFGMGKGEGFLKL